MPLFCGFFLVQNSYALSTSSVQIQFWSTSSSGNISTSVNLPWNANIGGSSSSRGSFYLNQTGIYYGLGDISDTATAISGRAVLRINPQSFADSSVKTYICDKDITTLSSSGIGIATQCSSNFTFWFEDGTTSVYTYPVYFNFDIVNQSAAIYVDYNYNLPSKKLTAISFWLQKTGNYDVFSIQNAWGNILTINSNELTYFISDPNASANEQLGNIVNQNQTMINQNQQMIDQENAAVDNIENQSPDDYSDTENQATTNIIGVISSFFGQFTNFTPTNCEVTLPFPDFLGGDMEQNICSGKDQAGEIISIVGSLIMVGFYIPLAFALLKMIYSEIRSFTNG